MRWAVGDHSRLLDGTGHVATLVLDVADQQRATCRAIQLHVSNFVDRVESVAHLRYAANSHAHGDRNQGVNGAEAPVDDGAVRIFGEQNVVHVRQPWLWAAGKGELHVANLH